MGAVGRSPIAHQQRYPFGARSPPSGRRLVCRQRRLQFDELTAHPHFGRWISLAELVALAAAAIALFLRTLLRAREPSRWSLALRLGSTAVLLCFGFSSCSPGGFARHTAYERKSLTGAFIARGYCRLGHVTVSLLPDFLASRLPSTLVEVEQEVALVELRSGSIAATAARQHPTALLDLTNCSHEAPAVPCSRSASQPSSPRDSTSCGTCVGALVCKPASSGLPPAIPAM